ncbi:hypothetical protein C9374_006994 [Naegleria lovaniensis]|uniref:G-patch domain-containing protein n=1 Tax=Naegleria lovaniensis TaxID=51637 RepID=A0AA88H2N9_NAELO|nr:uncharacterized protein C9374_006994 [Naegleria lovaniensis]KAG2393463.1 hypothetical protein C9374_006994 [Naegleria lovaniensis]
MVWRNERENFDRQKIFKQSGGDDDNKNVNRSRYKKNTLSKFTIFGTPIFDGEEENQKELKAHGQERYISEHQQYAKDEKGRRRFHGAFTGGFSAGYFNTVGSKEGWVPKNDFKSNAKQKITDFMDEEDMKELFGLSGSNHVQVTDKFRTISSSAESNNNYDPLSGLFGGMDSKDRKHADLIFGGSTPMEASLSNQICSSSEATGHIGHSLLRKMGWIPGRGIGIKNYKTIQEKPSIELHQDATSYDVTLKENQHGLGYKANTLGDILQNDNTSNNPFSLTRKKDIDDDIYTTDDLSNYDIELRPQKDHDLSDQHDIWNEKLIFIKSSNPCAVKRKYMPPKIPDNFTTIHIFDQSQIKTHYKKLDYRLQLHLQASEERRKKLGDTPVIIDIVTKPEIEYSEDYSMIHNKPVLFETEKSKEIKEKLSKVMSQRFVSSSENLHTPSKNTTQQTVVPKGTRVITDWIPDHLLSKRFGLPPISSSTSQTMQSVSKSSILDSNLFTSEESSTPHTGNSPSVVPTIRSIERMEDSERPSLELFKYIFDDRPNQFVEIEDDTAPSNKVDLESKHESTSRFEPVTLEVLPSSFKSVGQVVQELKEKRDEKTSQKPKFEKTHKKSKSKEEVIKSEIQPTGKEGKRSLDFNVYPIKKDSTSSYISQLESRISDIKRMLDSSSSDDDKKKRKKHKTEKKEKKKRKKESSYVFEEK